MKFIANKNEDRLNRNQICVWIHIIKSLTNFASKCSKIHAPLQRLFWSVGTECIVVALWYSFGKLCSIWCSLFWATPQTSEPRVKKRKMSRHSTKKKGNSSHKLKQKLCSKKNVNQTHNLIHNVSENAKYACEKPAILQDPTVPATEDSVQIQPNVGWLEFYGLHHPWFVDGRQY